MIYRKDKYGNNVSQLGFGCMRFAKKGVAIDLEETEKEILKAVNDGINYFDTAYVYPGSEEALGKIISRNNIRDKIYIATKLPQYIMKNNEGIEKTFREELKRLRTDYIDYYLMHMFTDYSEWEHLKSIGIIDWINQKRKEGSIKQIGFSYHGETSEFIKLLHAYDWDFAQIQYNYLDEHSQAGRRGLDEAKKLGIPIVIMEPLRGGKLVNLPEKAMKILKEESSYTAAELSFRWLWNQEGIMCVLSGMNSIEMLDENIRIASDASINSFSDKDFETIEKIKVIIKETEKVACTGCRYCMPCPKGVDIPSTFFYYNRMYLESKSTGRFAYAQNVSLRLNPGYATLCVECGKCEKHCPQHIEIRKKLKEADKALRPWYYKVGVGVARKIIIKKKQKKDQQD